MAGLDHRTVWRFTSAVLGQGFSPCCCATCFLVQTVFYSGVSAVAFITIIVVAFTLCSLSLSAGPRCQTSTLLGPLLEVQFLDKLFSPVVVQCQVLVLTVPDEHCGRRLGCAYRVGPTSVGRVFDVFSPIPGAGPFLSCSASSSSLSGSGGSSRNTGLQTFRLAVPMMSHAYGLLQEFIPVVFDYRVHDLRCGGLLLGQEQQGLRVYGVVGGVQAGVLVVLVCDGHVHALTQLTCQWTQL